MSAEEKYWRQDKNVNALILETRALYKKTTEPKEFEGAIGKLIYAMIYCNESKVEMLKATIDETEQRCAYATISTTIH